MRIQPLGDFLFNTIESTTTDKENVLGIHRNHFLVGMLTASLGRNVHHRSLKQFQQTLLHPFSTYVASDRRIVSFAGDLVYLIDKHNSLLSLRHIIVCHLKQTGQNAFNIFTDITGFRQYRSVYNRKRNMKQLGNSTCQQCFPGSGTTHHDNVWFFNLYIITAVFLQKTLIMVVNRYGKKALRIILSDYVLIEEFLYFYRFGQFF